MAKANLFLQSSLHYLFSLFLSCITLFILVPIINFVALLLFLFKHVQQLVRPTSVPTPSKHCILITGASSGIGKSMALEYAMRYASKDLTLILMSRNISKLQQVKKDILKINSFAKVILPEEGIDIRNRELVAQFMQKMNREAGPLTHVIANAGVSTQQISYHNLANSFSDAEFQVFDTNVQGVLNTVLPAVDLLKANYDDANANFSSQITIVSSLSIVAVPFSGSYGIGKQFVFDYATYLRPLVSKWNIKVTAVLPGWVETPMAEAFQGDKPGMIPVEQASKIIVDGLQHGQELIYFPRFLPVARVTSMLTWEARDVFFNALARLAPVKKLLG